MLLDDGRFCEEDDPKQAMNFRPKGFPIPDPEAEKIGLKAYLDATGWGEKAGETPMTDAKAMKPAEAENKAVAQAATEDKSAEAPSAGDEKPEDPADAEKADEPGPGLHVETESRRRPRTERA
jgi:hypothetical protein